MHCLLAQSNLHFEQKQWGAQKKVHHLGCCEILGDIAHPGRRASVQERGGKWRKAELVTLLFKMAADRQVIAKYADATIHRSGRPCKTFDRGIALGDLRKHVKLESRFDRSGLLIGNNRVHEQIR